MSRLRIPLILIIGLAVGLGLGLYIGWEVAPTEYVNANPAYLAETYQQEYVRMVATAYAVDGDLAAAQMRLVSLGENGGALLTAVMLDTILQQQNETEIRQLVNLAAAVGITSPAMEPYLPPLSEGTP
ncbi:MAG: hypothetical protein HC804_08355 [Anaerolineae bacterium]|nr:hypothetical protein [Anaerolineae bacterium]